MAKVKNIKVELQIGSERTYFATWEFDETTKSNTTTSSTVKVGDWVTIKAGARYYNGVGIPDWVMSDTWYVTQINGKRAVLGKNKSGTKNIVSPISTDNLIGGTGSSSSGGESVDPNTVKHYEVRWFYDTGNGVWFESGGTSTTEWKNHTYDAPENAIKLKVSIKPIAKTHVVNNKEVEYWTGESNSVDYNLSIALPPDTPPAPDPKIEDYNLTATIMDITDARTDKVQFEIYDTVRNIPITSEPVTVIAQQATYNRNVTAGGKYKVRARAIYVHSSSNVYSEWTSYSDLVSTKPNAITAAPTLKAMSESSVYVEWVAEPTAETYDIEYTTELRYFDDSNEPQSETGIKNTHFEVTGLTPGDEYFFRVRAVNEHGEADWSEVSSVTIGEEPGAPTTWSSSTTVIVGEPLILYWVHNSLDNSAETYGELELTIDGTTTTKTIAKSTDEDEQWETSYFEVDTSKYKEGTKILWRVRTAGITKVYGEHSIQREVDIYAQPTLDLSLFEADSTVHTETLTQFPLHVKAVAGPNTQEPVSYHLSVTTNSYYETVDNIGNVKMVNAGDEIYSKHFDTNDILDIKLSAADIDFEHGITYTVKCVVYMNSGLTVEVSKPLTINWTDETYDIDAEIGIDESAYSAYIKPYCNNADGELVEGVKLSVYRREYDGTFTEIATGLDNTTNTYVTDPHPSLDYARYRVVAITDATGAVSFYDVPAYPVGAICAVIQWDEVWSNFDVYNEDALEQPAWSGSLLKLPYNFDVSDNHSLDVGLIEYIGRKHPVAYYGTQVGESSTWNLEIVRDDKETLYAIRRLAKYTGDVYVREPSGSGYWANVSVSFSQKHCELTIPVTFSITRVEGGI